MHSVSLSWRQMAVRIINRDFSKGVVMKEASECAERIDAIVGILRRNSARMTLIGLLERTAEVFVLRIVCMKKNFEGDQLKSEMSQ